MIRVAFGGWPGGRRKTDKRGSLLLWAMIVLCMVLSTAALKALNNLNNLINTTREIKDSQLRSY